MKKFDYKKWVTDYKNGKPLFEQATGSYTGSAGSGSYGSGSYGSGSAGSGSYGSGSAGSGSCNPSSWSNYSNWINNILPNNGAFSSSNPNQPCQFLCNRISAITNQIPTVGPNWANQLECKIEEFQNQSQVNNCNC